MICAGTASILKTATPEAKTIVPKFPIGTFGRRGLPRGLVEVLYADYLRLDSVAKVAAIHNRTRQAVWQILRNHKKRLRTRRLKTDVVIYEGEKYSPDQHGTLRATRRGTIVGDHYLHRRIWIASRGPIPASHEVVFINGDKRDLRLENLRLMKQAAYSHQFQTGRNQHTAAVERRRVDENTAFVRSQARSLAARWPGLDMEDLVQEGLMGLLRAHKSFDKTRGVKFLSYAGWAVRTRMWNYISKHCGAKGITGIPKGKFPQVESLETPLGGEEDFTLADVIGNEESIRSQLIREESAALLHRAIARLPERTAFVLKGRFFERRSLEDLAGPLGVSREAVRQIELSGLRKLRRSLLARQAAGRERTP